jgi:hypothetical protein
MRKFFLAALSSSAKKGKGKMPDTQSSSIKQLRLFIQSPGKEGISSG